MTSKQSLVAVGGIGLIVVNYWTGPGRHVVGAGMFQKGGDVAGAHGELRTMGAELLFVIIAAVLAGISDSWGTAMVAAIVGLFLLWAINHYSGGVAQGANQ